MISPGMFDDSPIFGAAKAGNAGFGQQIKDDSSSKIANLQVQVEKLNNLLSQYRQQTIQAFSQDTAQLMRLDILAKGGGAQPVEFASTFNHPFRVEIREDPDNPGVFQYFVHVGTILKSLKPTDLQSITGLETWTEIEDDNIWIDISVTGNTPTSATISSSDDFDLNANPFSTGGYVESSDNSDPLIPQNKLRVLIAVIEVTDPPTVTQVLFTNLLCSFYPTGVVARPAVVALPSPY